MRWDRLEQRLCVASRVIDNRKKEKEQISLADTGHPPALWFQVVAIAQFSRCLQMFSRSHQLSDLPDMSQIVHGPLMQHLLQGDFANLVVPGAAFPGASRQASQILHVGFALLLKMLEGRFGVGIAVQLQKHLRLIGLELG